MCNAAAFWQHRVYAQSRPCAAYFFLCGPLSRGRKIESTCMFLSPVRARSLAGLMLNRGQARNAFSRPSAVALQSLSKKCNASEERRVRFSSQRFHISFQFALCHLCCPPHLFPAPINFLFTLHSTSELPVAGVAFSSCDVGERRGLTDSAFGWLKSVMRKNTLFLARGGP